MEWIDRCLTSLHESNLQTHIIVIDNLSTDGTAEYIENHFKDVELIRSKDNLGFGRGNNIGLKRAIEDHVDFVFLLNQDAWVKKETLDCLVQSQQDNPEYGIVSPVHMNKENTALETKFAEYSGPDNTLNLLSDMYFKTLKPIYETKFVNAAAWLISKECLVKVGGFNPLFPHYGEDEDFINRVKFWGFKVGINPLAQITHDSIFNWDKIEFNSKRNLIFNYIPLANINHRSRSAWLLFLKRSFDELGSYILFRKFKKFKLRFRAFIATLFSFHKIRKFRTLSSKEKAFLD